MGEMWDTLLGGRGRKDIVLLEGSQVLLTRPSDKTNMKVKTLEWLEIVGADRGRGILIFWINAELHNLEKKQFGGFHCKEAWFWWM
jgi:hypothetical protein